MYLILHNVSTALKTREWCPKLLADVCMNRARATGGTPRMPSTGPVLLGEQRFPSFQKPVKVWEGQHFLVKAWERPLGEKKALYLIRMKERESVPRHVMEYYVCPLARSRDSTRPVPDVSRGAGPATPESAGGGGHRAGLAVPPGIARLPGRGAMVPGQHGLVERLDRLC